MPPCDGGLAALCRRKLLLDSSWARECELGIGTQKFGEVVRAALEALQSEADPTEFRFWVVPSTEEVREDIVVVLVVLVVVVVVVVVE